MLVASDRRNKSYFAHYLIAPMYLDYRELLSITTVKEAKQNLIVLVIKCLKLYVSSICGFLTVEVGSRYGKDLADLTSQGLREYEAVE